MVIFSAFLLVWSWAIIGCCVLLIYLSLKFRGILAAFGVDCNWQKYLKRDVGLRGEQRNPSQPIFAGRDVIVDNWWFDGSLLYSDEYGELTIRKYISQLQTNFWMFIHIINEKIISRLTPRVCDSNSACEWTREPKSFVRLYASRTRGLPNASVSRSILQRHLRAWNQPRPDWNPN